MNVTLRGDDVQGIDTQWNEVLSIYEGSAWKNILESVYKTRLRDLEQLKTIFALYNQDTVQKKWPASYTRLKNMVKKYLDQKTKDRNIDARSDRQDRGSSSSQTKR